MSGHVPTVDNSEGSTKRQTSPEMCLPPTQLLHLPNSFSSFPQQRLILKCAFTCPQDPVEHMPG